MINESSLIVIEVSPYIGEWIEILLHCTYPLRLPVSPYIGEWIEIAPNR